MEFSNHDFVILFVNDIVLLKLFSFVWAVKIVKKGIRENGVDYRKTIAQYR